MLSLKRGEKVKLGKNKSAQTIGQVFVFILAGLIFILIITYGYNAVKNFMARSEEVALVDFRNDFESAVEKIKYDYGSVRRVEFRLPAKFSGVCVLDINNCPSSASSPELVLHNKKLSFEWMSVACRAGSANVFTVPRSVDLFLPDVVVDGFVCVPVVDGKVILRFEGLGKKARVSSWQ